ncbi:MAG: 6-phosphofructokinase [Polyangiales bacterium]
MALQRGDRLAVLTSGGDAPGMNAALRAAARVGAELGFEVLGVEDGYTGLLDGRLRAMELGALDEAARCGGTILGTARSKVFPTPEGHARARAQLVAHKIDGLLVIGGNGSLAGAATLLGAPTAAGGALAVAGVPASIDNDLACTSMAIGVDTAMNTIVEAIDRIYDTASAHRRTFFIEVMGRDCGYLAMTSGIAAGADAVLVPEVDKSEEDRIAHVVNVITRAYSDGSARRRVLVIKAEGAKVDLGRLKSAVEARIAEDHPDVDTRITVLGHVVRGGSPSAFDRLLAARLANAAVRALAAGESGFMAGWVGAGASGAPTVYDPAVLITPIPTVLAETERLMRGDTALAQWRRRVYREVEPIIAR